MKQVIEINKLESVLGEMDIYIQKKDIPVIINAVLHDGGHPLKYVFCVDCGIHMLKKDKNTVCVDCRAVNTSTDTHGLYVEADEGGVRWAIKWKDSESVKVIKTGYTTRESAEEAMRRILMKGAKQ